MRRPINWVVFCMSLLFLLVNLSASGRRVHQPEIPVPLALFEAQTAAPEFGYVRADGTFLPLARDAFLESSVDTDAAALAWSTPWLAPAGKAETPAFTSASPSWQ
jgi:hypothetical protein